MPASRAVKSACATASSGTVATVVTSTPPSRSSEIAMWAMSSTSIGSRLYVGQQLGQRRVQAALLAVAAAAVVAAAARGLVEERQLRVLVLVVVLFGGAHDDCSWLKGAVRTESPRSRWG